MRDVVVPLALYYLLRAAGVGVYLALLLGAIVPAAGALAAFIAARPATAVVRPGPGGAGESAAVHRRVPATLIVLALIDQINYHYTGLRRMLLARPETGLGECVA